MASTKAKALAQLTDAGGKFVKFSEIVPGHTNRSEVYRALTALHDEGLARVEYGWGWYRITDTDGNPVPPRGKTHV